MRTKKLAVLDDFSSEILRKAPEHRFDDITGNGLSKIGFEGNVEVFQPERAQTLKKSILLEGQVFEPIQLLVVLKESGEAESINCLEGRHRVEAMKMARPEFMAIKSKCENDAKAAKDDLYSVLTLHFESKYAEYRDDALQSDALPKAKEAWVSAKVESCLASGSLPSTAAKKANDRLLRYRNAISQLEGKELRIPAVVKIRYANELNNPDAFKARALEVGRAKELNNRRFLV